MFLETQRLILRNLKEVDLPDYLRFRNSEFVLRYNAMARQSAEQAEEYIRSNLTNDRHVAIALKDTDAFVGMIYIEEDSLRYKANSLEASYWLGEPYSAQGIMTEALGAVVQQLFAREQIASVTVRVFADNPGSGRLLRRLGFRQEGHLREAVLGYDGALHDDLLFSLRRDEQVPAVMDD